MHYFDNWTGRYILRSEMIMFNGGFFTFKIYYKFINLKKNKNTIHYSYFWRCNITIQVWIWIVTCKINNKAFLIRFLLTFTF